ACEEPFAYLNRPDPAPAIARMTLPPGAAVRGRLYIYDQPGEQHAYQPVLEHFNTLMKADHPPADLIDLPDLIAPALQGIARRHYHERGNYFVFTRAYDAVAEQIANAKGVTLEWHQDMTGFVGGMMACHALMRGSTVVKDDHARRVAAAVADHICRDGL